MKKLLLLIFLIPFFNFSQTTAIPDQNFEQALIDQNIDSDGIINGEVLTSDISSLTNLNLGIIGLGIIDLTGIEDFISLSSLNVSNNNLTSIDVSNNISLETLSVNSNQLTSIDVSNNTSLTFLQVSNMGLTSIDLSNNINLTILQINNTELTSIDLSNNINLERLFASDAQLTSIDVSNNTNLFIITVANNNLTNFNIQNGNNALLATTNNFSALGNPNLLCIQVDDVTFSENTWANIDSQTIFSTDCSTLSTDDFEITSFKLFPNPTTDILNIELQSNVNLETINIYNNIGQFMSSTKNSIIDTSNFSQGIYLVEIITDLGKATKKLVIE